MKTIQHIIQIGEREYLVPVKIRALSDAQEVIDVASLKDAQKQLARELLAKMPDGPDDGFFNFLMNISGMTNSEVARYMRIDPSAISQWRRGTKKLSSTAWQAFRIFFDDIFTNGNVTLPMFLGNKECKDVAA
jgi:DNA-binding transcriptional regulator YiaG